MGKGNLLCQDCTKDVEVKAKEVELKAKEVEVKEL